MSAGTLFTDNEQYDAIIVLGGGIVRTPKGFVTTTYEDGDHFGMLGGRMRLQAAVELHRLHIAPVFVCTTGISAKSIELFGADVPTEASVYADEFKTMATHEGLDVPYIILEDTSQNTVQNIQKCLRIITEENWHTVLVLSSEYHIPRVQALTELLMAKAPIQATVAYRSAEEILRRTRPGVYDDMINEAYASELGMTRQSNEREGLLAIQRGAFTFTEHQLERPNA